VSGRSISQLPDASAQDNHALRRVALVGTQREVGTLLTQDRMASLVTYASTTEMAHQVEQLYVAIAAVCREVGCPCLADRFSPPVAACGAVGDEPCQTCGKRGCKALPHKLAKLAPLVDALDRAGYHFLALMTAQLALACEPTQDLELSSAYLQLLLGDNEEAARIYQRVLRRQGAIPAVELERLRRLVAAHQAEDDISELYNELSRYAPRHPA